MLYLLAERCHARQTLKVAAALGLAKLLTRFDAPDHRVTGNRTQSNHRAGRYFGWRSMFRGA